MKYDPLYENGLNLIVLGLALVGSGLVWRLALWMAS